MYAFCGIIEFGGKPIVGSSIKAMLRSLVLWEPDHEAIWQKDETAFGQLNQVNLPESKYENLPSLNRAKSLAIVSDARIDNRDELCDAFDVEHRLRSKTPDSTLILLAYEKWGNECPNHLLGDFVIAIYDRRKKELFCARDHLGARVLFFHHQKGHLFTFATSIRGITKLPSVPIEPNYAQAARQLALVFPAPEETFYKNIFCLMPGQSLTVSSERGLITRQYWEIDSSKKIRYRRQNEYVEHFDEIFKNAVSRRLRSIHPIGSHLSGGLDSSSVAAVAAILLKEDGKKLNAFGSVPPKGFDGVCNKNWVSDDRENIIRVAKHVGNIKLHLVEQRLISCFSRLETFFEYLDAPFLNFFNTFWLLDIALKAKSVGIKTILTGAFGNGTISYSGDRSLPRNIYRTLKKLISLACYGGMGLPKDRLDLFSALNPRYSNFDELTRLHQKKAFDFQHRRSWLLELSISCPNFRSTFSPVLGVEHPDPSADKEVFDFCMGLPASQFASAGNKRLLIRRTMDNVLPREVVWATHRGAQAVTWEENFENCKDQFVTALKDLNSSSKLKSVLDLKRMQNLLNEWPARKLTHTMRPASYKFLMGRGILLGKFLLWIEEFGSGKPAPTKLSMDAT